MSLLLLFPSASSGAQPGILSAAAVVESWVIPTTTVQGAGTATITASAVTETWTIPALGGSFGGQSKGLARARWRVN